MQDRPPPWSLGHERGRPRNKCRPGSRIRTGNGIPSGSGNTGRKSGATRHITDIASQEVAITRDVGTSASITTSSTLPPIPRNLATPHTGSLTSGNIQPAGRSVTSPVISGTETPIPTLSYYGDLSIVDSASRAHALVGDVATQPLGDMAITSRGDIAILPPGDTAFVPLYTPARDAPISVGE